jgi:ATP-dependent DNA ligase
MRPVAPEPTVHEIAAAWQPQRPGRRAVKDIEDALVEPAWGGVRVAAAINTDAAAVFRAGAELALPDALIRALVDAFDAVDAVIEGHLTTLALRDGTGLGAAMPAVERPPLIIPRAWFKSVKDDPYVRARDYAAREAQIADAVMEAIADGVPHAFVATDLLWLDGTLLADVPLLERRRLLEGALVTSDLVRVSPVVRPTAVLTLVTWGQQGFAELSYRAANSRYTAGSENADWAVARPPEGPHGPARTPTPK